MQRQPVFTPVILKETDAVYKTVKSLKGNLIPMACLT